MLKPQISRHRSGTLRGSLVQSSIVSYQFNPTAGHQSTQQLTYGHKMRHRKPLSLLPVKVTNVSVRERTAIGVRAGSVLADDDDLLKTMITFDSNKSGGEMKGFTRDVFINKILNSSTMVLPKFFIEDQDVDLEREDGFSNNRLGIL